MEDGVENQATRTLGPSIGVTQDYPATFGWRLLMAYLLFAISGGVLLCW